VQGSSSLNAGPFSVWLEQVLLAISGKGVSEVPCGDCTACCTSSQFVHIGPDETDTLAHVPRPGVDRPPSRTRWFGVAAP